MIEIAAERIIGNLILELPDLSAKIKDFFSDSDIEKYGIEIPQKDPRNIDNNKNTSYYIGEPEIISEYPAVCLIPLNEKYSENTNVNKYGFQSVTANFLVRIFYKIPSSVRMEFLYKGIMRLTKAVVDSLRFHANLTDPDDDSDPICKKMGIGDIRYIERIKRQNCFIIHSEFPVSCLMLDSAEQRAY